MYVRKYVARYKKAEEWSFLHIRSCLYVPLLRSVALRLSMAYNTGPCRPLGPKARSFCHSLRDLWWLDSGSDLSSLSEDACLVLGLSAASLSRDPRDTDMDCELGLLENVWNCSFFYWIYWPLYCVLFGVPCSAGPKIPMLLFEFELACSAGLHACSPSRTFRSEVFLSLILLAGIAESLLWLRWVVLQSLGEESLLVTPFPWVLVGGLVLGCKWEG